MAADPYKYFRIEARELVDELGKGVLDLEKGPAAAGQVARLLRLAHTLKGAARVVKAREIADGAHAIEDVLAPFRDGPVVDARGAIDRLLTLLDAIGERLAALAPAPTAVPSTPEAEPVPAPAQVLDAGTRTVRADIGEVDSLIDGVSEAQAQLGTLRRGAQAFDGLKERVALLAQQARSRGQRQTSTQDKQVQGLVEELQAAIGTIESSYQHGVEQVERELREVRTTAERLRLLPVALMLSQLERTARDAAQALGKSVLFESQGGDVRLDADVLAIVQQALVQLVRNAVAHGIELQHERKAATKSEIGRVTVEVIRQSHRVAFRCRDDGRGIDSDAVRRAAQAKGLLPGEIGSLSDAQLSDVLLSGGISTSRVVTEVSGRGLGLDVVRDAATRLGGELRFAAEAPYGTVFELIVPVSLTSLDGLLVEAADQAAVIPLDSVRRALRLSAADVASTAEGESVVFEGKVIPFAPLERSLRMGKARSLGHAAQAMLDGAPSMRSAVVVESRGRLAAIGVDRLLRTENVLLRSLSAWTPVDTIVAGASLDAEGAPQLVLDPEGLVAAACSAPPSKSTAKPDARPILVIDDSLTTRMLEQSILEAAGYDVDLAISGEEGLAMARRRKYALLLVDVEMPGIDGFEVIARLRADPELRHLPAILVTSRNSPEDLARGQEVGAQGHIVKSEFDQIDFLAHIQKLVG